MTSSPDDWKMVTIVSQNVGGVQEEECHIELGKDEAGNFTVTNGFPVVELDSDADVKRWIAEQMAGAPAREIAAAQHNYSISAEQDQSALSVVRREMDRMVLCDDWKMVTIVNQNVGGVQEEECHIELGEDDAGNLTVTNGFPVVELGSDADAERWIAEHQKAGVIAKQHSKDSEDDEAGEKRGPGSSSIEGSRMSFDGGEDDFEPGDGPDEENDDGESTPRGRKRQAYSSGDGDSDGSDGGRGSVSSEGSHLSFDGGEDDFEPGDGPDDVDDCHEESPEDNTGGARAERKAGGEATQYLSEFGIFPRLEHYPDDKEEKAKAANLAKGMKARAKENKGKNPHGDSQISHPRTACVIYVWAKDGELALVNKNGEKVKSTGGKWVVVRVCSAVQCSAALRVAYQTTFCNVQEGTVIYSPTAKSGSGEKIPKNQKIIKVLIAATEANNAEFESVEANYHIADEVAANRLLHEAVVFKTSLIEGEFTGLIVTDLNGNILGKYNSPSALRKSKPIDIKHAQLKADIPFEPNTYIRDPKCACTSNGRRFVFYNAGDSRFIIQLYDKDNHGEWSDIEVGDQNGAHGLIPKKKIEDWRGMVKRKKGRQSQGGVYALDGSRKVMECGDSWKDFRHVVSGCRGIKVDV